MVNITAEYCASLKFNTTHVHVNVRLDRVIRTVSGKSEDNTAFLAPVAVLYSTYIDLSQKASSESPSLVKSYQLEFLQ